MIYKPIEGLSDFEVDVGDTSVVTRELSQQRVEMESVLRFEGHGQHRPC